MSYEAVAENSKNLARKYVNEGNFGRAFSHYLVALKLNSSWREEFREEFSTVLCKWGTVLDERKRYSDLCKCYEQALEIFPNSVVILNNLGAHLLRCGLPREAAHYFRKCLDIDRYFIRAAHNLESVANSVVERWHFRMLNDKHRNEAFREAIIRTVTRGFHRVLDVGTGTGLLSLFCAEGKANHIYACESSPVMTEIAEKVFHANNVSTVHLINKHSTRLRLPSDIPRRISLLVTETFDAALLGEDILRTLSHAWRRLLLPPHPSPSPLRPDAYALVLPRAAALYATGIQFRPLANDLHLDHSPNSSLTRHSRLFRAADSYDTQDLSRSPFKCLTATETVFRFDFNDPDAIAAALRGHRREVSLRCITSGRLDCFAVWFDLYLDEDIVLNTSPLSRDNSAWDQAVFPLRRSILVEGEQDVAVAVAVHNGRLRIDLVGNEGEGEGEGEELSDIAMRTLMNEELGRGLEEAGRKLAGEFDGPVTVLDCYPFPVFGLKFLAGRRGGGSGDRVSCVVGTEGDRRAVKSMAEREGIEAEVAVRGEGEFWGWLEGKKFDVIALDVLETSGELKDGVLLELDRFKSLLKPHGIILPEHVTVMAQFLHSDWLSRTSMVINDSVTCGYNIAEFINPYQVRHFIDLNLKTIEKTFCTEPFELFSLWDNSESVRERTVAIFPDDPVHANALAYWLRIRFVEGCDEVLTNEGTLYQQAAFLFPKTEFFRNIKFNVIRNNGLFSIELLES